MWIEEEALTLTGFIQKGAEKKSKISLYSHWMAKLLFCPFIWSFEFILKSRNEENLHFLKYEAQHNSERISSLCFCFIVIQCSHTAAGVVFTALHNKTDPKAFRRITLNWEKYFSKVHIWELKNAALQAVYRYRNMKYFTWIPKKVGFLFWVVHFCLYLVINRQVSF